MLSRDELERASRELDGELPQSPELAGARQELEALLGAAASLDVELPPAHVDRLVQGTLGPRARRRWPWAVAAAAVVGAVAGAWWMSRPSAALADVAGIVAVNGHAASEGDAVPQGAVVETGVDATVRLPLDGVEVTLAPNSRLVVTKPLELRAGVAFVRGSAVKLKVGLADAAADGETFVVAEPAEVVDRVTAQLAVQETDMRTLLLSLMLPAVALGGSTTPAVVPRSGTATLNDHDVKAGDRAARPVPQQAPPSSDALAAQIAALTAEQATLRKRLEALEARSGTPISAAVVAAPVRGTVVDPVGHPVAGVAVMMFAADRLGEQAYTDTNGRFSLDPPADAEGIVYAYKDGRSAFQSAARPGMNLALQLIEPGKVVVQARVNGAPPTSKVTAWTSSARIAASLPGVFQGAKFEGDHIELTRPAGELMLHVEAEEPHAGAHVPVRVEPGRTISVTVDLQHSDGVVHGRVIDAVTRRQLKNYEVQLLLPDDSLEAGYTSHETIFGFGHRTSGERVILINADGYKPLRARVTIEPGKTTEMGSLAVEPL
jgi:hypothetical protein